LQAPPAGRAAGASEWQAFGELLTITSLNRHVDALRHDRIMDRRRCMAILSGTSCEIGEHEIVFDDARAVDFTVHINCTYSLE